MSFQFCCQLAWHPPCRHFRELQNIMDDMVCWSLTHIQMCGYFIHCYMAIFLHDGFNCCNGLWCHYWVCLTRSRRWQKAVLLWCMLQVGPPSLHYYLPVVLHSCIVLSPVGHSSNHQYHCCQLRGQLSCVSNFYRTFKFFIWLSLIVITLVCFVFGNSNSVNLTELFWK